MPLRIFRQWFCRHYHMGIKNKLRNLDGLTSQPVRESIVQKLWGYYNSPINAVFVTTNVFLFVGVVTYNTLCQLNNERLSKNAFLGSLELQSTFDDNLLLDNKENRIKSIEEWFLQGVNLNKTVILDNDQENRYDLKYSVTKDKTVDKYTLEDIQLGEFKPLNTISDQIIKYSLFQLFYAFTIYQKMLRNKGNEKDIWISDLQKSIRSNDKVNKNTNNKTKEKKEYNNGINRNLTVEQFYLHWKKIFHKKYDSFYQITQFEIPSVNDYQTGNLNGFLKTIQHIEFHDINQINKLYDTLNENQYKKILRIWLYDNIQYLHGTILKDEEMFRKILHDSINDANPTNFLEYSSIILNSDQNFRVKYFLPILSNLQLNYINFDTILDILDKYVALQRETPIFEKNILQIIKLIKTHGVLNGKGKIQILLESGNSSTYKPLNQNTIKKNTIFIKKKINQDEYFSKLSESARLQDLLKQTSVLFSDNNNESQEK